MHDGLDVLDLAVEALGQTAGEVDQPLGIGGAHLREVHDHRYALTERLRDQLSVAVLARVHGEDLVHAGGRRMTTGGGAAHGRHRRSSGGFDPLSTADRGDRGRGHDVVVVFVDQLHVVDLGDRFAQLLVAIIVVADFLHHLARLDAEPLSLAAFILGLARGRAH